LQHGPSVLAVVSPLQDSWKSHINPFNSVQLNPLLTFNIIFDIFEVTNKTIDKFHVKSFDCANILPEIFFLPTSTKLILSKTLPPIFNSSITLRLSCAPISLFIVIFFNVAEPLFAISTINK